MCQESLFDAQDYVREAYEKLVLAYSIYEIEEIAMLKRAVLRGYVGMREKADQLTLERVAAHTLGDVEPPL